MNQPLEDAVDELLAGLELDAPGKVRAALVCELVARVKDAPPYALPKLTAELRELLVELDSGRRDEDAAEVVARMLEPVR